MPFTIVTQGTILQPATAVVQNVELPSSADYFKVYNLTQAAAAAPTAGVLFEWFKNITPQGGALQTHKAASSALLQNTILTGGFTYVERYPDPEPAIAVTAVTAANPAVVSAVNTYSNGDRVVLYGTTGMQQISGMVFTVSAVSGVAFTLAGLNAVGFATPATAGFVRRVAAANRVEPRSYYVTGITRANPAVVTLSEAHNLAVGMKVEFQIPGSFGMVQLNNYYQNQSLPPVITAVSTYTITLNIDTSAYTAFAFPASSATPTTQLFATVAPAGASTQVVGNPPNKVQTGYDFAKQAFRTGLFVPYMILPIGANAPGGQANDRLLWQAFKMEAS